MLEPFFALAGITAPAIIHGLSFGLAFAIITFLHIVRARAEIARHPQSRADDPVRRGYLRHEADPVSAVLEPRRPLPRALKREMVSAGFSSGGL